MGKIVPLSLDKNCPASIFFVALFGKELSCLAQIILARTVFLFDAKTITRKFNNMKNKARSSIAETGIAI